MAWLLWYWANCGLQGLRRRNHQSVWDGREGGWGMDGGDGWCWERGASCVFVRQAAVGLILPCGKNANAGDWFGPPGLLRMRAGSCAGQVQEIVIEVLY